MDSVDKLSNYIAGLTFKDLPAETVENAKRLFLDLYSCTIAGTKAEAVPQLVEMAREWGGKGEATLLMDGGEVPAPLAGLVNTVMSHARDYDDTHDAAVLHTSVVVIPAALAAAQVAEAKGLPVSGRELIAAIVAGVDVHCKLSMSFTQSVPESGFTYTALCGYFAAAATAAKMLGLDETGITDAIGLAYTQCGGTNQAAMDAVLAKRCQPGFATLGGVLSAMMASKGITGVHNVFDGKNGFYHTYMKGNCNPEVFFESLGKTYEVDALSYKPYPCCRFNHAAITLAKRMMEEHGIAAQSVKRVDIATTAGTFRTICEPLSMRQDPQNAATAQFSLPFTVACQIATGGVTLANFTDEGIRDPRVRSLIKNVTPVVDDEIEREYGRGCGAVRIKIETDKGVYEDFSSEAKGSPDNPMSLTEIEDKVQANAEFSEMPYSAAKLDEAIATIEHLDQVTSIKSLIQALNAPFAIP